MEAAHIESEVEGPHHPEPSGIPDDKRASHAGLARPAARLRDRAADEVHTHGFPAVLREVHHVRARPASEIERPA